MALTGAAVAWAAALGGRGWGRGALAGVAVGAVLLAGSRHRRGAGLVLLSLAMAGALSGWLSAGRERAVLASTMTPGPVHVAGRAAGDLRPLGSRTAFLLVPSHLRDGSGWRPWPGPPLLVLPSAPTAVAAGDRVVVRGTTDPRPGRWRGDAYAARIEAREVAMRPADDRLFSLANRVRERVLGELEGRSDPEAAALLAGFLIGEVGGLDEVDLEAMRRSGLSHFVAVSGSNVALVLLGIWLATAPVVSGTRGRALVSCAGLVLFVAVTRWEPSVLRAATMAGMVLAARAAGLPLTVWTALGGAVTLLVLVSGELVADVGFQLSVAATLGVLAGADLLSGGRFRRTATVAAATLSAQAAVAPLLLWHFGAVPLLAPLTNLVAAPLVALATVAGGIGVLSGAGPLIELGVVAARLVLSVARLASGWPQLGVGGVGVVGVASLLAVRPGTRPLVALGAGAALAAWSVLPAGPPSVATAVFLDVGQGDAALLLGPGGETIVVDGGPEPARMLAALRRYGVRRVDLAVLSHPHEDHLGGLEAVVRTVPVGMLWHPAHADDSRLEALAEEAARRGARVAAPGPSWRATVGAFEVRVLGPLRRYASPNDGSLVLVVEADGVRVLLPGDIERVAQQELGPIPAEVMKVPHQGAATSDLGWLEASAGRVAVVSVGPNAYGHPSEQVLEALAAAGAQVLRTDLSGDVVVPLEATWLGTVEPTGLGVLRGDALMAVTSR